MFNPSSASSSPPSHVVLLLEPKSPRAALDRSFPSFLPLSPATRAMAARQQLGNAWRDGMGGEGGRARDMAAARRFCAEGWFCALRSF